MARHPSVQYVRFCTDGNAARKVEVAAPIKTMRLPRVKKQRSQIRRIDLLAVTAIVMTVVMTGLIFLGLWRLHVAQQETIAMQANVDQLQEKNDVLQTYYDDHLDLDQIERTAMALGLVPKEQVTHITIMVPQEVMEEESDVWERFTTFLTGLFA